MCINFSQKRASETEFMALSVAGHLVNKVNAFRNEVEEDAKAKDSKRSDIETLGRRVVAGLGYATLAVVALAEMVARVALGLLLVLPCAVCSVCCMDDWDLMLAPLFAAGSGLVLAPEAVVRCFSAFVQNCYRGEIHYEDLLPCGVCVDDPLQGG